LRIENEKNNHASRITNLASRTLSHEPYITNLITKSHPNMKTKTTLNLMASLMMALFPLLASSQSTSDYDVCQGATETYWIESPGTGSTFAWTITPGVSGTDWTVVVNNNDNIQVQWILPGIYTVEVVETSAQTCVGDPITVAVTIVETPTAADAGPDQTLCGTLAATLAGNTPTAGTGEWTTISGPGTITYADATSPTSGITASDYGTYVLRWTISNDPCTATFDEVTIILNPPVVATATSNSPVCETNTLELYCDISGATYAWTGPNGFTSTDQNPVIPNATPLMSGIYTVVVSNIPGGCPDATDDTEVTVNPKPVTNGIWHN